MPIQSSDIRLLESERMTDTTDGGGRRTNRVIPDGVAGNIFPKVSRVDSVYGRVNLLKIYPHVNTADLDVYAGAHFVITDAPDNGRINVLAFSTGSDFDQRTSARDRIESYVIAGPLSRMTLYGRQLKGAGAILVYQRKEEPLPEVGEVFAISAEVGSTTTAQQFVRATDISHEVRTFEDGSGAFDRRIITIKIGSPLRYEFTGIAAPSRFAASSAEVTGRLRTTTVADAARYYGIQPLTAAVSSGALELSVASVYAPIVPTTQRETPLSLARVAGAVNLTPTALSLTPWITVYSTGNRFIGVQAIKLPRSAMPGQVYFRTAASAAGGGMVSDEVAVSIGGEIGADGLPTNDLKITGGFVDFESGAATVNLAFHNVWGGALQARFMPAVEVSQPAHTTAIQVTLATRGTVYSVPLLPIPAPGTLIVDYRALGKWYRLRDDGTGELSGGDAQYGTGTVDYVTGAATITLGALPDVGSSVLMSWGSPVHYEVRTSDAGVPYQEVQLAHFPVKPASLSLVYQSNGIDYTVTAHAAGALSGGGASGSINHVTGLLRVQYGTRLPDYDGTLQLSYQQQEIDPAQPGVPEGATLTATATIAAAGGTTVSTGVVAEPGSVTLILNCRHSGNVAMSLLVAVAVDAAGAATTQNQVQTNGIVVPAGVLVGTFDHATGVLTLGAGFADLELTKSRWTGTEWVLAAYAVGGVVSLATDGNHSVTYMRRGLSVLDVAKTETLPTATAAPLRLDLTRTSTLTTVPGSVMFSMAGKTYIDRSGTLYTDFNAQTGSALAAGTIDYASGIATPTIWTRGAAPAVSVNSLLVKFGDYTDTSISFRTAGSPIRPASLYIQCTALDGELLTGTSDASGIITGGMTGVVEQTMGVVNLDFAKPVLPGTLRYSAVVLSNLPLDADILGLDPVRLPSDGRVPIYRPADVTVIHHTDIHDAGTPEPGEVISVGRTGLSALWLEDANKKKLSTSLYAVDLAAGTATMAADLDLTGYVPPIAVKHRIEEMNLLSDVQINGQVTLTAPLSRDFPAGSLLSSALLYGDLQARVTNLFDQQTWTSVWQNTLIGSGANAQFNDVDYPVEVLNNGAITERWRLSFTTTTSFQVIGENMGVIGTGTTGTDLQVVNQLTGLPYFTLRAAGWGSGWATGNQLRFDTIAAAPPTWLARCVLPGAALIGDSFDAQLRGDVD